MERRGFLEAMLAAGMAPAVVKATSLMPVRALPSGIVVPAYSMTLGNRFIVPSAYTDEVLRILLKNLSFAASINRAWDGEFQGNGRIRVALPKRFESA